MIELKIMYVDICKQVYCEARQLNESAVRYAPRAQRQLLQLERLRSDEQPKCHGADENAHDVDEVVAYFYSQHVDRCRKDRGVERTILRNVANSTAVDAAVLFGFGDTVEWLCDEVAFEHVEFRRSRGRLASSDGESVDEFENEESREGTAEVADAVKVVSRVLTNTNRT
jgi:hypothetical protein